MSESQAPTPAFDARFLQVGEAAPDVTLSDPEGRPVSLSDYWQRGPALLAALRHLG